MVGIFTVDGEKWRHQRKTSSYEFSTKILRDFSSGIFKANAVKLSNIVSETLSSDQIIEIQVGIYYYLHAALTETLRLYPSVPLW